MRVEEGEVGRGRQEWRRERSHHTHQYKQLKHLLRLYHTTNLCDTHHLEMSTAQMSELVALHILFQPDRNSLSYAITITQQHTCHHHLHPANKKQTNTQETQLEVARNQQINNIKTTRKPKRKNKRENQTGKQNRKTKQENKTGIRV